MRKPRTGYQGTHGGPRTPTRDVQALRPAHVPESDARNYVADGRDAVAIGKDHAARLRAKALRGLRRARRAASRS